jgi:hypothetical protein
MAASLYDVDLEQPGSSVDREGESLPPLPSGRTGPPSVAGLAGRGRKLDSRRDVVARDVVVHTPVFTRWEADLDSAAVTGRRTSVCVGDATRSGQLDGYAAPGWEKVRNGRRAA